jgi:hypothetical protein
VQARALAGAGHVLAGEASTPEVRGGEFIFFDMANVLPSGYVRPVLRQHGQAERVNLDLADAAMPGPFKAKIETADARK